MKPFYKGERYRQAASPKLVDMVETGAWHSMDYVETIDTFAKLADEADDDDWAYLGAIDRYFLFTTIFGRVDAFHPWLFDRCREVELNPDGYLDLWARDHYKSSLITFAGSIQEIINDPEITIGVFSHTKPIAKAFVKQIRRELESNEKLRRLYPHVAWEKRHHSPLWTDDAFIVRRETNPKEGTVEAHGLVDGQPTSKHFRLLIYDDVVTRESVNTPDQIRKTTEAWELSDNLGSRNDRRWHIGTRYHFGDTYGELMSRNVVIPRVYPATYDGTEDGEPVFLSKEKWAAKKMAQRSTLAAQMLQNPIAGKERMFQPLWFRPYEIRAGVINVYIMGDPSKGSTNRSDRTAIPVIGIDANNNKYLLDGYCHRMNLGDRWKNLKNLHKKWSKMPGVNILKVGWERFGQQTDDEFFKLRMQEERYFFNIEELAWPRDNTFSKADRVERLQPDLQYSRFYMPAYVWEKGVGECTWSYDVDLGRLVFHKKVGDTKTIQRAKQRGQGYLSARMIRRIDENGDPYDVTKMLMDELSFFPFSPHDDLCDAASRIYDMDPMAAVWEERGILDKVFEDA